MTTHFRSLWISDTHLGGRNLKSHKLYQFLKNSDSDYLYLVGDIFDLLKLSRKWYWPGINNQIVNLVLQKAKNGTEVVYLPGNHDAMIRSYCGETFNNIKICHDIIHTAADGRKYLVLHGDQFDCVVQKNQWLAIVGGLLYDVLLNINRWYNSYRILRGKEYFSISALLKHKCKKVVNYISNFEVHLINEIKRNKVDGIVCGHIHHASIKMMGDKLYGNSGDWVESCTALAENINGTMGIIHWAVDGATESIEQKSYEKDRVSDGCLAPSN